MHDTTTTNGNRLVRDIPSPLDERLDGLKALIPEAFGEEGIDWERLRAALGAAVDERPERYSFSWAGKREAMRLLQVPSHATLLPAPDASMDFDTSENLFIEGDNLEVLKLLYKSYFGRVKMIYIDPPYNTGNDFVYHDDFADPLSTYLQLTGQKDHDGNLLTSNPEKSGRYHSAWLSMMYPRLFVARQLLRDDGVIFASIDDHEVHNLRMLMNEIFGEENFVATIVWQKAYVSNMTARHFSDTHDYILVYARNAAQLQIKRLARTEEQIAAFTNPDDDPRGPWKAENLSAGKYYSTGQFEIVTPSGRRVSPPPGRYWRCNQEQYEAWLADGRITFGRNGTGRPMLKKYLSEVGDGLTPNTWWEHEEVGSNKEASLALKALFDGQDVFDTPKPVRLIRRMLELTTDPDSIVLDFFAGSGTTAEAVLQLNHDDGGNRRFIVVQLPESTDESRTIADVAQERVRRVVRSLSTDTPDNVTPSEGQGFRVFRLAESHLRPWTPADVSDAESYASQMSFYDDVLRSGWTPTGVLFEIAIKEGYSLSSRVERDERITTNAIYRVTDAEKDQTFHACLDQAIDLDSVRALGLGTDDLFVCRDSALTDSLAANLALQCRLLTI